MEFSFDRSKDAHLRRPESQPAGPQVRPGPDLNTVDPSTIANERLRKAIERNRAKQAQRAQPASPVQETSTEEHQQDSFFSQTEAQSQAPISEEPRRETPRETPRETLRSRVRENIHHDSANATTPPPRSTSVVSRRSVAKPEDTEFVPVKRTSRKVASHVSYTTSSTRKKAKSLDPKYVDWLVKGSWIFCGIMILRLIFAAGGVTDFYSQKSTVNEKMAELTSIKKENMQLVREIERMRSDTGFQKKLVRDNLGFIASDEFLVLFPKEK